MGEEAVVEEVVEATGAAAEAAGEAVGEGAQSFSSFASTVGENLGNATADVVKETTSALHLDKIKDFFTDGQHIAKLFVSVLVIAILFVVYKILKKIINGKAKNKIQPHTAMILNKLVTYVFYILVAMYILSLFGVNLNAIWGAAGIAGLAIGFAAQTSVSNIISGLFVLGEKALKVGDFIEVAGTSGVVDTVGLLSVKIHTLDNQMVRIPNSSIIDSNLVNYSQFDKRRLVFEIPLDYADDMTKALEAVKRVPGLCPTVLKNPEPVVFYDGFGDAVNLRLAVWFKSTDLIQTKNDVYINVVKVFNEEGLTIPFTHYDIKILENKKPGVNAKTKAVAKEVVAAHVDDAVVKLTDSTSLASQIADTKKKTTGKSTFSVKASEKNVVGVDKVEAKPSSKTAKKTAAKSTAKKTGKKTGKK